MKDTSEFGSLVSLIPRSSRNQWYFRAVSCIPVCVRFLNIRIQNLREIESLKIFLLPGNLRKRRVKFKDKFWRKNQGQDTVMHYYLTVTTSIQATILITVYYTVYIYIPVWEALQGLHDHEGRLHGPLQPLIMTVEPVTRDPSFNL